jgi:hypothetical protein
MGTIGVEGDKLQLFGSFQGEVIVDGTGTGALVRVTGMTRGDERTFLGILGAIPPDPGWAGKRFNLRVSLPANKSRVYRGCFHADHVSENEVRITFDSVSEQ